MLCFGCSHVFSWVLPVLGFCWCSNVVQLFCVFVLVLQFRCVTVWVSCSVSPIFYPLHHSVSLSPTAWVQQGVDETCELRVCCWKVAVWILNRKRTAIYWGSVLLRLFVRCCRANSRQLHTHIYLSKICTTKHQSRITATPTGTGLDTHRRRGWRGSLRPPRPNYEPSSSSSMSCPIHSFRLPRTSLLFPTRPSSLSCKDHQRIHASLTKL